MTFDICLSIQKSFRDHHLLRPEPALVRPPKRLLMNWNLCLRRNKRCSPRSSNTTKQGLSRGTHPLPSHHYHYHCDHPKLGETYIGHGNHPKLAIHLEASGQGQLRGPWNLLLPAERLDMYCGLRREVDWRI